MDFPSNSFTSRTEDSQDPASESEKTEASSDPKQVKKVVSGKVTQRPKPLGKRFKEMFVNTDGNIAEDIAERIVVPMIKDMALSIATQMVDSFRQGVEEMLFGPDGRERRSRNTSYGTGRPVVNYTRYSSTSSVRRAASTDRDRDRPIRSEAKRRSNRVKEIIVEDREDGDAVIEELNAMIDDENIGHCTVGDFYAACGESTRTTDELWGWTDLTGARVRKLDEHEYLIVMPPPRAIDS